MCQLRCAAEFLNMKGPGNLIDITEHVLHELLTSAKLARAVDMLTSFVLTCKQLGEYMGPFYVTLISFNNNNNN